MTWRINLPSRAILPSLLLFTALASLPARASAECTDILTDHFFDGTTEYRGPVRKVRIRSGRIESITSGGPPREKADECARRDLRGLLLTPGLIDLHTHLFIEDRTSGEDFSRELLRIAREPVRRRSQEARLRALSMLRSGITSIRDLGNSGRFLDAALAREIEARPGAGPRLHFSGPGIAAGEGQFPAGTALKITSTEYVFLSSGDQAETTVGELAARGAKLIKVFSDNDPNPGKLTGESLSALVRSAHARGLRVAGHSTDAAGAARAVEAGVDTLEHGYALNVDTLRLMKERGTFLIPTDFSREVCESLARGNPEPLFHPCTRYQTVRGARLRQARDLGVRIAFGSDMYYRLPGESGQRGPASLQTLIAYVEEGLTPLEALRAATSEAARALGTEDLGAIRPGALADLAAFAGDPLRDIRDILRPRFVMKGGALVLKRPNREP